MDVTEQQATYPNNTSTLVTDSTPTPASDINRSQHASNRRARRYEGLVPDSAPCNFEMPKRNVDCPLQTSSLGYPKPLCTQPRFGEPDGCARIMENLPPSMASHIQSGIPEVDMSEYRNRLKSFTSRWPYHATTDDCNPEAMASMGYFLVLQTNANDEPIVQCFKCGTAAEAFTMFENPITNHIAYRPNCEMLQNFYRNLPEDSPLYKMFDIRMGSYIWKGHRNQVQNHIVTALALAGLYVPNPDKDLYALKCYSCKHLATRGEIINTRNPWSLHCKDRKCEHKDTVCGYIVNSERTENTIFDQLKQLQFSMC